LEEGKTIAFFVTPKEKNILSKQQAQKTPMQLVELAEVMEIARVPANTNVYKGETLLYPAST
jgi:hypothetical protein